MYWWISKAYRRPSQREIFTLSLITNFRWKRELKILIENPFAALYNKIITRTLCSTLLADLENTE